MERLRDRLARLEDALSAACQAASRPRETVTLIGVSKTHPDELVREAWDAGLYELGENRVQALLTRYETLSGLTPPEARWHLIGPVQTNKAKLLTRRPPALLHTLDRLSLVDALEQAWAKAGTAPLDCLIQVNIDREPQKAGVLPEDLEALVAAAQVSPYLRLRGLMAIPAPLDEVGDLALQQSFEAMERLFEGLKAQGALKGRPILSMGMSDDFALAIAHGATHVRIGSALFGSR